MSLQLYLLRHGETLHSRTGTYCGDLDPELTAAGQQMAESFAMAYAELPWDAIYVSPMQRTVATAKPICETVGLPMQLREGLKEIRYGQWEGQTQAFVRQHYPEDYLNWMTEPAWNPPTDGETALQVANRASPVVTELEERYSTGHVLIVSHKATLRIILCHLLGIELGRYRDRIDMPVASVSVIRFDHHGPLLQRLGDRSHLPEALQQLPGT
jgi:broad specificity phosphatase PhoE